MRTFQQTRIYGKLNCIENMLISHKGSDADLMKIFSKIPKELTIKRKFIKFCGIISKKKAKSWRFIFWQQKLLGLAMALMNEPEMFLLDEPQLELIQLINGIIDRLIKVKQDFGITLLVIEHNMRVLCN
ncbi:MAG: hypothetical protein CM1200mP13_05740 [Candidatus Pelagibacterales bacterium]|nr:MAG: hypothetical protein CM1200mP13_05740 [Pelagibacterales bacterium]